MPVLTQEFPISATRKPQNSNWFEHSPPGKSNENTFIKILQMSQRNWVFIFVPHLYKNMGYSLDLGGNSSP